MTRARISNYIVAGCVAGSFILGLTANPSSGAQGGAPERVIQGKNVGGKVLEPLNGYNTVLGEIKDRFYGETPSDIKLTYQAIHGLLKAVDDPYTRFMDPEECKIFREKNAGEFVGIGALLDGTPTKEGFVRVNKPLKGGPAMEAGLQKGDLIEKVDGKTVVGQTVDQVVKQIRGTPSTKVRLTIQRPGKAEPIEFNLVRRLVEVEVVESEMKEGQIGYITLSDFSNQRADEKLELAVRELKQQGMKGLVLDLRGNPGGLLDAAIDIVSRFVPSKNNAVIIVESGGERSARRCNPRKYLDPDYPIVVLINRGSASASEIVAGAFKDTGAGTVVGQTTYGKGLVQTVFTLPQDNSAVVITTHKYLTSMGNDIDRTRTRRGGVVPDVAVEFTEKDFIERRDPQMAKALEILYQKTGYVKPAAPATATTAKPPGG